MLKLKAKIWFIYMRFIKVFSCQKLSQIKRYIWINNVQFCSYVYWHMSYLMIDFQITFLLNIAHKFIKHFFKKNDMDILSQKSRFITVIDRYLCTYHSCCYNTKCIYIWIESEQRYTSRKTKTNFHCFSKKIIKFAISGSCIYFFDKMLITCVCCLASKLSPFVCWYRQNETYSFILCFYRQRTTNTFFNM